MCVWGGGGTSASRSMGTGIEEKEVLVVGSIPVAILSSCQYTKCCIIIALT